MTPGAAARLVGMTRVAQQRAVNACLAEELATSVHALAMELSSGS